MIRKQELDEVHPTPKNAKLYGFLMAVLDSIFKGPRTEAGRNDWSGHQEIA